MCTITLMNKKPGISNMYYLKSVEPYWYQRGTDGFSITFISKEFVNVHRFSSIDDIKYMKDYTNHSGILVLYSRAVPETEMEIRANRLQPIVLVDDMMNSKPVVGTMLFINIHPNKKILLVWHHGLIHKIDNEPIPEKLVDSEFLAMKLWANDNKGVDIKEPSLIYSLMINGSNAHHFFKNTLPVYRYSHPDSAIGDFLSNADIPDYPRKIE